MEREIFKLIILLCTCIVSDVAIENVELSTDVT